MSEIKIENNKNKIENSSLSILKRTLKTNIKQYTMFIALIALGIIFTFLTDGTFLTPRNLSNLLLQTATIAILACGMVLVIIEGHIDLSVGSVAGFTGAIAALLQVKYGWGTAGALTVAVAVGFLVGLWQGYWIAYQDIPAFIVTLAGMLIFRGGVIGVTNGETIAPLKSGFKAIGQGYIPGIISRGQNFNDTTLILGLIVIIAFVIYELRNRKIRVTKYNFKVLPWSLEILKIVTICVLIGLCFSVMIFYRGMPYCILLLLALILIFSFIANKTQFGRYIYAIGGNREAARLSGINTRKVILWIFILMGTLSAVSGIVFTARLDSATASAGNLFELDAIASCFIGGASAMGGEGTVIGSIIGSLVMATINNGMSLMNVHIKYQYIVKGLILLFAVWADIISKKKNG